MKIFYSESIVDYSTYTFNYTIYCLKESQGELPSIYEMGFLPYSNNISIEQDIFYLARSIRVDVASFEDTSENRRVNRSMQELDIEMQLIKKEHINTEDTDFQKFCTQYIQERIGEENMIQERFHYILQKNIGSHFFVFYSQREKKKIGYVYLVLEQDIVHYWFSFFDTKYMKQYSLGKWMMWKTIRWAKDNSMRYVYLGTAYNTKSLYKVRNHRSVEFFNGYKWDRDMDILRKYCQEDTHPIAIDKFKQIKNYEDFFSQLNFITHINNNNIKK